MSRTAIAILSSEHLLHNLALLKKKAPKSKIIAMVKANAYGHGLRSVASRVDGRVDCLGVASIDEALALRQAGIKAPIMLAEGVFEPNELVLAATNKFEVVFHYQKQIDWLAKSACPLPLRAWLKINTGMGRLGFVLDEASEAYARLHASPYIQKPLRVLSHFACADEREHPLNQSQIQKFQHFIAPIQSEFSFCNSAAIFHFPDCHYDYVRPGLALYGVSPITGVSTASLGLKPVMTLQSTLIAVRHMPQGAYLGYGARYQCPETMPVGVVAMGYGDGYPISARDGTPVLVNNIECPIVGRVSMDMMTVDLRGCPQAEVGDPVILWGQGLPIERVVEHTSNIVWDLLTGVQHRVKFLWTPIPDLQSSSKKE